MVGGTTTVLTMHSPSSLTSQCVSFFLLFLSFHVIILSVSHSPGPAAAASGRHRGASRCPRHGPSSAPGVSPPCHTSLWPEGRRSRGCQSTDTHNTRGWREEPCGYAHNTTTTTNRKSTQVCPGWGKQTIKLGAQENLK